MRISDKNVINCMNYRKATIKNIPEWALRSLQCFAAISMASMQWSSLRNQVHSLQAPFGLGEAIGNNSLSVRTLNIYSDLESGLRFKW
jgi:hypothetical protein